MPNENVGAYVIYESQIKFLEGRLLTHVEASVPAAQQVALKSLVSNEIWSVLAPEDSYLWIEPEEIAKLGKK